MDPEKLYRLSVRALREGMPPSRVDQVVGTESNGQFRDLAQLHDIVFASRVGSVEADRVQRQSGVGFTAPADVTRAMPGTGGSVREFSDENARSLGTQAGMLFGTGALAAAAPLAAPVAGAAARGVASTLGKIPGWAKIALGITGATEGPDLARAGVKKARSLFDELF